MKKKLCSLLLCLCMIAGIMPQITLAASGDKAFDAVSGYDIATVRYIFSDGTYKFADIEGDASTGYDYTIPEEDSSLKVAGEYTQDDDYSLPASADSVIVVAEYFNTEKWDGAVDISWYDPDEDVFYLSTPAQLAGLAAIVNGAVDADTPDYRIKGDQSLLQQEKNESASFIMQSDAVCYYGLAENSFADKTVYLTADMDMGGTDTEYLVPDADVVGGEYPIDWDTEVVDGTTDANAAVNWTPIGGLFALDTDETGDDPKLVESSFNGVLDGLGHKIYNLYCNRYSLKGFSYSHGTGFIGNIGAMYSGQETPEQNPAVRNLSVNGYVLGRRLVGGIVGNVGGTVGDGDDDSYAENPDVYIENCANYANVFCTDSKGVAGIVAGGWGTGHIYNCYNAGNISSIYSSAPMGGICASNSGMDIYNCYNTGTISSVNSERARAIGSDDSGVYTVDDCYYLEGCDGGYGYNGWYMPNTGTSATADCVMLTKEEMKSSSFVDLLNNNGKAYVYNEGGYPLLAWEADAGSGQYSVTVENPTTDDGKTETIYVTYSVSDTYTGTGAQNKIIYLEHESADGYAFRAYTANGQELSGSHYTVGEDTVISADWEEKIPGVLKVPESGLYTIELSKDGYQEVGGVLTAVKDAAIYENEKLYEGDVIYAQAALKDGAAPSDINYTYDTTAANPYEYYFTYIDGSGSDEVIVEQTSSVYGYHEVSSIISQDGVYLEVTVVPVAVHKDWSQIYDESWYDSAKASYSAASEFEISSAANLAAFRKLVNEGYDFSGKTVYLTADISLSNQAEGDGSGIRWWKGIGDTTVANAEEDQKPFSGTFDGQGYSITDMTAVNTGTYSGLFSYTENAVIKNLTVDGRVEAVGYLGGIVGRGENTIIENCTNYAKVTGTTGSSGTYTAYAGGIAGYLEGSSRITDCSNYGVITNSNGAGGIAGYISGTTQITDCLNAGSVIGMKTGTNGVGGIAGQSASGTILRCANYGMVSSSASYTGGIVGAASGTRTSPTAIEDCFNAARVRSSSSSSTAGVGGITGYGNYFNISSCFNFGDIADVSGSLSHVGAVIGRDSENSLNEITNTYYLDSTCEYSVDGQAVSDISPAESADSTLFADGTILGYINVNGSFVQKEGASYPELEGLAAENSEALLTVYVRYGYGENEEVRTYSLRELLRIASSYPVGLYQYGTSGLVASDTYVTIDDLVYDSGLTFSGGDSLEVAQVGDPYSVTWEDLCRCSYYIAEDGTVSEAPNAILIDWGQSQAGLEETINNIQSYKDNPSLRFGMGSDPEDESSISAGYRLVSGVKTLVIVHPPKLSAAARGSSVELSWDDAEDATGYELLKLNDETGEWEVIFESENVTEYTDSDVKGCGNTCSYKIRVYSGSDYMDSDVTTAAAHTITVHEQLDATCTEEGHEAYYECTVCGKLFSDEGCSSEIEQPVKIPAAGHVWDEGKITTEAPDYESEGIKTCACTVCGAIKTEVYTFVNGEVTDNVRKAILWAAESGISKGYTTGADAGTFGVGNTVTREEMVIFLYRLAKYTGNKVSARAAVTFNDAREIKTSGGKTAISWAVAEGITSGYSDGSGNFGPQDECTREQICIFLWRLAGKPAVTGEELAAVSDFADADKISNTTAKKAIAWAYSEGIIRGYTDSDDFGPKDSCLREQFAIMMYRYAK